RMMQYMSRLTWRWLEMLSLTLLLHAAGLSRSTAETVLASEGSHFVVNGRPCFLLGISYYGGLGASADFIREDMADARRNGLNWLRVWATWAAFGNDVSAVGVD